MMDSLQEKYEKLREIIENMGSVLIAFSGGVDSTFLLKVAHEVLGDRACAVTAVSPTYPESEFREAVALAQRIGARHLVVESNELEIPGFAENPEDRCYHCKRELFGKLAEKGRELGISWLAEGSNVDDLGDYRPGRKAVAELSVRSPLLEAGLSKEEIRLLSRDAGLPTWDKQPYACLSSRFPFGVRITAERLRMIEACEDFLKEKGFRTYRVRFHDETARIEVGEGEIARFLETALRREVSGFFRSAGFTHVALDLQGYRTGSMNYIGQRTKGERYKVWWTIFLQPSALYLPLFHLDVNLMGFGFCLFRQGDGKDAPFARSTNLSLVDGLGQEEAALECSIEPFDAVVIFLLYFLVMFPLPPENQGVVFNFYLDILLIHAGQFGLDDNLFRIFIDIDRGLPYPFTHLFSGFPVPGKVKEPVHLLLHRAQFTERVITYDGHMISSSFRNIRFT
jgi:uncharacterized protein